MGEAKRRKLLDPNFGKTKVQQLDRRSKNYFIALYMSLEHRIEPGAVYSEVLIIDGKPSTAFWFKKADEVEDIEVQNLIAKCNFQTHRVVVFKFQGDSHSSAAIVEMRAVANTYQQIQENTPANTLTEASS